MAGFEGQRVLIVGGSSGIGRATAGLAASRGAAVTIASRDQAKLDAAAKAIGHGAVGRVLDVTSDEAVDAFFADGAVWDHVVVTAAALPAGPVREISVAVAQASMNAKFWGAYRVARAATFADGGTLTFVGGLFSQRPAPGRVVQSAINAALEGLTRGLAVEFAPLRVNTVAPGVIDTPVWDGLGAARDKTLDSIAARLPVRRIGRPEDVALQIAFFMETPFATGMVTYLDGGAAII